MDKKFVLTDETKEWYDRTLYRIKALKDFNDVQTGDLGGWVEKEDNLSQEGDCWVYENAKVFGHAFVRDNARIFNYAEICGNAEICDGAMVYGHACVDKHACVYSDAKVYGRARIGGHACVFNNAQVYNRACVYNDAEVFGNAQVFGYAEVFSDAKVCGEARVGKNDDILCITGIGSRCGTTTVCRDKDNDLVISCGCFEGNLDEFAAQVKETHGDNKYGREYNALIEVIKAHFNE